MKKFGILVLMALVGGAFAYGQSLASDSHRVIVEMGEVYRIVVSRVGTPEKDVHMLLDPFKPVEDDSTRLSYYLNRIGPNGTQILWACTWPRRVNWVLLEADASWSAGLPAPAGHTLGRTHLIFCNPCMHIINVLVDIARGGAIGWFPEQITIVYTATVLNPSVPAGTTETGEASFWMQHTP